MWYLFLHAFAEKKIDVNAIPLEIWQNNLNLSKGRITAEFATWFVESYLKLAKPQDTVVEKDHLVEGQFLIKDKQGHMKFIVRDFAIAEKVDPKDYIKTERVIVDKAAEAEKAKIDLIKSTFSRMHTKDGLLLKGKKKDHFSVFVELENAIYVYPFTPVVELAMPFKKQRIYITVTNVRNEGKRVHELLKSPDVLKMLEDVGRGLALWHVKSKARTYADLFCVGFDTITHGNFTPDNVLYHAGNKKITFLNNEHMADAIKSKGRSNWHDIKTFIKDLTPGQTKAFLTGYVTFFKNKGCTVEKMEAFIHSDAFKSLK